MRDPFYNRQDELRLFQPLYGNSMLELGNKKNGKATYKNYFEKLGFRHYSVDINGEDGAMALDLREPLDLGTFDMVSNIGTTEHVGDTWQEQEACWVNILDAMHVGSILVSITPLPGYWKWHGRWHPYPEFFDHLANQNGLDVERCYIHDHRKGGLVYARLQRRQQAFASVPQNMLENEDE